MDLELTGKTAFVSGSTQGIGFACAQRLAAEGVAVVLNGREEARVHRAVEALSAAEPQATVRGIAADFGDSEQVDVLLNRLDELGPIDLLVNNVGVFGVQPFVDTTDVEWARYLEVNLMSGVRLSRHLLPQMIDRGWGRVLFVSSESGVDVPPEMVHYGVTKAALVALGNGLAKLTRGTEVTVNTVLGGPTWTEGVAGAVAHVAQVQGVPVRDLRTEMAAARHTSLAQRFLDPDEIAHLITYLASPLASATNGAAVRADGGILTTLT